MPAIPLPQGLTQFTDQNGVPYAGGRVYFYLPATLTAAATWQDYNQTILNSNPVTLDSAGRASIWGAGRYRQILQSFDGVSTYTQVWDQETVGNLDNSLVSTAAITFQINGGGSPLTTGVAGDIMIPFAATITQWTLLADQTGSVVVNVWKNIFASYPPTSGNKITASAPPTITTAAAAQSSTLTGWTTTISAGDTLRFNVDSVTTITRVTLVLTVTKIL